MARGEYTDATVTIEVVLRADRGAPRHPSDGAKHALSISYPLNLVDQQDQIDHVARIVHRHVDRFLARLNAAEMATKDDR